MAISIISPLDGALIALPWMPATNPSAGSTMDSMKVKLKATQVRNTKVSAKFTTKPRKGLSVRDTHT